MVCAMTTSQVASLPDEDRLELPAAWKRYAPPVRGQGERPGFDPDPMRARIASRQGRLKRLLLHSGNAEFADAAQAYLSGAPEPTGAAAVAATEGSSSSSRPRSSPPTASSSPTWRRATTAPTWPTAASDRPANRPAAASRTPPER